jgi:hypothetical protein
MNVTSYDIQGKGNIENLKNTKKKNLFFMKKGIHDFNLQ